MELFGPKRTYDDFKNQVPKEVLEIFEELRNYCLSLGSNVVEDVRAHRIVFGKSISFRWFLDLEPDTQSITAKIQRDRKEQAKTMVINPCQNLDGIKGQILDAYNNIR